MVVLIASCLKAIILYVQTYPAEHFTSVDHHSYPFIISRFPLFSVAVRVGADPGVVDCTRGGVDPSLQGQHEKTDNHSCSYSHLRASVVCLLAWGGLSVWIYFSPLVFVGWVPGTLPSN